MRWRCILADMIDRSVCGGDVACFELFCPHVYVGVNCCCLPDGETSMWIFFPHELCEQRAWH